MERINTIVDLLLSERKIYKFSSEEHLILLINPSNKLRTYVSLSIYHYNLTSVEPFRPWKEILLKKVPDTVYELNPEIIWSSLWYVYRHLNGKKVYKMTNFIHQVFIEICNKNKLDYGVNFLNSYSRSYFC